MEGGKKKVIKSSFYYSDIQDIYEYGEATFGIRLADSFFDNILYDVENLETQYLLHPECRHLETKTKIYRNIIIGSYLIIHRIRVNRIEVLRAFHGSRSPKTIKQVRKVKL
ncbi:plasmid stabilization system protein ParE [Flavobacterium arsenatis]|uniref:Plasmid stabilization system protein ParE n=1 Tax=Flavobacterium arsenatis TaxID=1484332 RepID=A0ABU1TLB3_9FLAO|nr:type II toxin-antitoxin system RelE/ParE family toxin [Flavobacterium arsenatis]MDR6966612.1 plasmid stabilization system protein ParE [Flavobacterium arsenatis]